MSWFPVSQVETEFAELLNLFDERQPQRILEIGVAFGGTLYNWIMHAPTGALVACVDLFEHEGVTPASLAEWRDDITLRPIEGDSTDAQTIARAHDLGPFDWVFIDGSHALADVTSDWLAYGSMVERGIVAFHDISEHDGSHGPSEVRTLWQEIVAGGAYRTREMVVDPPAGWAGIGVVYIDRSDS